MRRRRRLRKVLLWGAMFVASVLAGSIWFAYTYITDSDTLAQFIRDEAPRYLPTSRVEVERVLLRPLVGDVQLKQARVWQTIDGTEYPTLTIPWLQVRSDFRSLLRGKITTREVVMAHPRLRIKRGKDGSWNLQGLLADPFPQTNLPKPVVTISKGEVVLDDGPSPGPILRDVSLKIEPLPDGSHRFEGDARGVSFERVALAGTFHPETGKLVLTKGDLTALTISDALRNRLPKAARDALVKAGLEGGEVDISVARLVRDPKVGAALDYEVDLALRSGVWKCPDLPFPLTDVSASVTVTPTTIRVANARGHDGKTVVRLNKSWLSAADPVHGPMELNVQVEHLELDERLKAKTPAKLFPLWADFSPPGRKNLGQVDASIRATRDRIGAEILYETNVDVRDMAIQYRHFPYPLDHVQGKLIYKDKTLFVKDFVTSVASRPLTCEGTIHDPGPDAVIHVTFEAGAMPVDEVLLQALPPDASKVVREFNPKGSVRGTIVLHRTPSPDDPKGHVRVDAELDLDDNCSIAWKGLPYPVRNLTGHLGLHPDRWVFTDMKGVNNRAEIAASGEVIQVSKGKFSVDLRLKAEHLPFDQQLRESLPREWERTWGVLNPRGSTAVDAHIVLAPGRPEDYKFTITPEPDTCINLRLIPAPGTEVPGTNGVIALPEMGGVQGKFFFDNGVVTMDDVDFTFRQAPVHFTNGEVRLKDSGAFTLSVHDLSIKDLRLEHELRKIMPSVMAQFARRLNDGEFSAFGNMTIGWSGVASEPAVCSWSAGRVVFLDNNIATGLPIEHIQGEVRNISGQFDGRDLGVDGIVDLASVNIQGQHLTRLTAPLKVDDGKATLESIEADLLGGKLYGDVEVTLDATPKYEAKFQVAGALLEEYARTIPGPQEFKGTVNARVEVSGLGQDLKTLHGQGEAHILNGDFGKLPFFLTLIEPLKLTRRGRAGFDAADVSFAIDNGQATLDPIKITSDVINLQGRGTVNHLGRLDLRITPLAGRDERNRIRGLNNVFREIEGQFVVIHVGGTVGRPKIRPEFLPVFTREAGEVLRKIGDRRSPTRTR